VNDQINSAVPGLSTVAEFDMGHLDFTLALDDGPITHVLQHMNQPIPSQFSRLDRHSPREDWIPACEAAKQFPFLFCFSKLDEAFAGLDRMHQEASQLATADRQRSVGPLVSASGLPVTNKHMGASPEAGRVKAGE